jgi:hypothetical protein
MMSRFIETQGHLARRFFTSLSTKPPLTQDVAWVNEKLLLSEFELWKRMKTPDQRHSIEVARRFTELHPSFTRDEVAAALLHDVGKIESQLGVIGRVVATIVGPIGTKFRCYHDHEIIGLKLCRDAGSSSETIRLLDCSDDLLRNDKVWTLLRQADRI